MKASSLIELRGAKALTRHYTETKRSYFKNAPENWSPLPNTAAAMWDRDNCRAWERENRFATETTMRWSEMKAKHIL